MNKCKKCQKTIWMNEPAMAIKITMKSKDEILELKEFELCKSCYLEADIVKLISKSEDV